MADLSTVFTGIRFVNPFLLASAPPTELEANIMRAFDAGWGEVVTKTIGLHPVLIRTSVQKTSGGSHQEAREWQGATITSLLEVLELEKG